MIKSNVIPGLSAVFYALNLLVPASAWGATPLGTVWTYQGELQQDDSPVNGTCDCQFSLWDDPAAGVQVGPTLTFDGSEAIAVADGVLSIALDFGAGAFNGDARWLEISVACPSGGTLETLSPRQPITAAPYALYSLNNTDLPSPWLFNGDDIYYDAVKIMYEVTTPLP